MNLPKMPKDCFWRVSQSFSVRGERTVTVALMGYKVFLFNHTTILASLTGSVSSDAAETQRRIEHMAQKLWDAFTASSKTQHVLDQFVGDYNE